jgi:trehalose-6-phosphatase
VLKGNKVIEVRLRGVSKATPAQHLRATPHADTALIAIGDDRTGDDLFRAAARQLHGGRWTPTDVREVPARRLPGRSSAASINHDQRAG